MLNLVGGLGVGGGCQLAWRPVGPFQSSLWELGVRVKGGEDRDPVSWQLWSGPGTRQGPLGIWASPWASPATPDSLYSLAVREAAQVSAQGILGCKSGNHKCSDPSVVTG